jgi:hypothetical protein
MAFKHVRFRSESEFGRRHSCCWRWRRLRQIVLKAIERLQENGLFEFSLVCLSRACLGKIIIFIYEWLKRTGFLPYRPPPETQAEGSR